MMSPAHVHIYWRLLSKWTWLSRDPPLRAIDPSERTAYSVTTVGNAAGPLDIDLIALELGVAISSISGATAQASEPWRTVPAVKRFHRRLP